MPKEALTQYLKTFMIRSESHEKVNPISIEAFVENNYQKFLLLNLLNLVIFGFETIFFYELHLIVNRNRIFCKDDVIGILITVRILWLFLNLGWF